MNKKMLGGIIVLIALVGIVGVFLLIGRKTNTESKEVYKAPSEEVWQKVRGDLAAQKTPNTAKPPPPGETFETGHWDGDHWHRTAPVQTSADTLHNDGEYGVTRQGKRYLKNPAWSHRREANVIPTGPPLTIDWSDMPVVMGRVNWHDPRTWESYRNFWGFDRPHVRENGTVPWRAIIDNHGTPLQMHENIALVTEYTTRIGFRPTPEQLEQYNKLQTEYEIARLAGFEPTAASIQQQIQKLVASAQGEIPNPYSYLIEGYGDPVGEPGHTPPEHIRKRKAIAVKYLYKRLGIPHLYELHEPK